MRFLNIGSSRIVRTPCKDMVHVELVALNAEPAIGYRLEIKAGCLEPVHGDPIWDSAKVSPQELQKALWYALAKAEMSLEDLR